MTGDFFPLIVGSKLIRDDFATLFAFVNYHPALPGAGIKAYGLHHAEAGRGAVAGADVIHMLAPEAHRAVVPIGTFAER